MDKKEIFTKGKVISSIIYMGTSSVEATALYNFLMDKKESKDNMYIGGDIEHRVEVIVQEVISTQKNDDIRDEIVYKVEFKAVVI